MPPEPDAAPTPAAPLKMVSIFPGFGVGGSQMRFAAIAAHFGARIAHTLIALDGNTACRDRLPPDLAIRYEPPGPRARILAGRLAAACATLRALAPDVVVTSNWGSIEWAMAARLAGLRHLHTEDGFGPEERDRQIPRRVITRRLALRGSAIILPSKTLLALAADIWKLPERRLHYIPNGIDLARFAPQPRTTPPNPEPTIGTIAALRPEKNIARLIEALAIVRQTRPARLIVVGNGPERPALEARAAALGLTPHIHFAGHSDQPETWLAKFDLFALSSDTEQMPLSILEAMAAGLPIASTNIGDVASMLAHPHVAAKDSAGLANAMLAALDDTEAGAANLARARTEFDQEVMFARYGELWFGKG